MGKLEAPMIEVTFCDISSLRHINKEFPLKKNQQFGFAPQYEAT